MEVLTPKLKRIRPTSQPSQRTLFPAVRSFPELAEFDRSFSSSALQLQQQFVANVRVIDGKGPLVSAATDPRAQSLPGFEVVLEQTSSFLDLWRMVEAQCVLAGEESKESKENVVEEVQFVVPVAAMNAKFLRQRADELNLNTTGRYLPYLLKNELHVSTIDPDMQNWVHASIPVMEVLECGAPVTMVQPFKAQIVVSRATVSQSFECVKAVCNDSICSDDDMEYISYTPFDSTFPYLAKMLYTQQASLLLELAHNQAKVRAFCVTDDEGDAIGDKKASDTITDALSSLEQSVRSRKMSRSKHLSPASPIVAVHPLPLEHSFPFIVKLLYTLARQAVGSLVVVKLAETASIHLRWRQPSSNSAGWEEYCVLRATGAVSAHDALVKLEAILSEQERLTAASDGQLDMEMARSPGGVRSI